MINDIEVDVILNESTVDNLTITKQPVQQGASITDHAFKEPTSLSMSIHQSNTNIFSALSSSSTGLSKIYQQFLTLQSSLAPFTVTTPKRIYKSMLISSLAVTTDKQTENILAINLTLQQIIIVNVTTTTVPRSQQANAAATGATQPAGKKSALATLFGSG